MLLGSQLAAPGWQRWFLPCLGLALTLRVDAPLVLLPVIGLYAARALGRRDRRALLGLGVTLALAGAFFALHAWATGTLLPLSFGHKAAAFAPGTFLDYLRFAALTLLPGAAVLLARGEKTFPAFAGLWVLWASVFYAFFMHWFFERYVFPVIFALFCLGLRLLFERRREGDGALAAVLAAYALVAFAPRAAEGYSWVSGYRVAMAAPEQIAAAFARAGLPRELRTYACYDAGLIAYRSGWKLVDLAGLTTPEVTRQSVAQVLAEQQPTVLLVSVTGPPSATRPRIASRYHLGDAEAPAEYRLVKRLPLANRYWWPESGYGYAVFVSPRASPALVAGLAAVDVDVESEMGYQRWIFVAWRALAGLAG